MDCITYLAAGGIAGFVLGLWLTGCERREEQRGAQRPAWEREFSDN